MRAARFEISPLSQAKAARPTQSAAQRTNPKGESAKKYCNKQDERPHSGSTLLRLFTRALEHSPGASIYLE